MENEAWKNLELTLKFKASEVQAMVEALANLPFHMSVGFINAIQQQTTIQIAEFEMKRAKQKSEEVSE